MSNIEIGKSLPEVTVDSKGEMTLNNEKVSYTKWNSGSLAGKVRMVQHLAGRSSAKDLNEDLISALKVADFPQDTYQTSTIVNVKDAVFGTSSIVTMKVEAGKKEFPFTSVIIDTKGVVQKTWKLEKESSAISVVDKVGQVLFFKDGKLTAEEVSHAISLIQNELATNA